MSCGSISGGSATATALAEGDEAREPAALDLGVPDLQLGDLVRLLRACFGDGDGCWRVAAFEEADERPHSASVGAVFGRGAVRGLSWKPNSSAHMKNSSASCLSTGFKRSPSSSSSHGTARRQEYRHEASE